MPFGPGWGWVGLMGKTDFVEHTDDPSVVSASAEDRRQARRRRALGLGLHALVGVGAAAAVALDRRLRRGGKGRAQASAAAVTIGFYGLLWAIERRRPYRQDWQPGAGEVVSDAAFLMSTVGVQVAAMSLVEPVVRRNKRSLRVDRLPVPVGAAIGVLAFDLVHSRVHQLGHRWGPAWTVHSVHHSPQRLYWFNATRFHGLEMFVDMALETMVMSVLGMSRDQTVAYQTVRGMYGQLQHCNVDLSSGPLDHVFSTPDLHRWHHSAVYREGDTNYGAITSVWDKVFGTFYRPVDRAGPDELGIGRMPSFPQTFWELERVPLDWDQIRQANADTWFDDRDADVTSADAPVPVAVR